MLPQRPGSSFLAPIDVDALGESPPGTPVASGAQAHLPAAQLSPVAERWLEMLARPPSWAANASRDTPAEFFLTLVDLMCQMEVFPEPDQVLGSWVDFSRDRAPRVRMRDLSSARPPDASVPVSRPWVGGFENYDGLPRLMRGRVQDAGGDARPEVSHSCALSARDAFEMFALSAQDAHRRRGQAWPPCCDGPEALQAALCRFLRARPELTEALARRFPLQERAGATQRAVEQGFGNARSLRSAVRGVPPEDLRLPPEVLRALLPRGGWRLPPQWRHRMGELGRGMPLMRAAWSMCFTQDGRLTVHGRQCLEPSLIRGRSPQAMRAMVAGEIRPAQQVRQLFDAGQDLAVAVSSGVVTQWQVRLVAWGRDPAAPVAAAPGAIDGQARRQEDRG